MFKNIEDYKNDGWGLSRLAFEKLNNIIDIEFKEKKINILEFGSGISTKFLVDKSLSYDKKIHITSFDDNKNLSYKSNNGYDFIDLKIRELVECDDQTYKQLFHEMKYDRSKMKKKTSLLSTKQKNNFYDIHKNELNSHYDLVILDGCNGNGRTLSYLHLKNKLKNSYFFIDDFNDHDIHEKFLMVFNDVELVFKHESPTKKHNQWNDGGEFIIYKIL